MKKFYILNFSLLLAACGFGQAQLENPGFEGAWEDILGDEDEPEEWSSLKTADFLGGSAPEVAFQETVDPHSGTYCIRLQNQTTIIPGVIANGLLTNGQVHAEVVAANGYVFTNVGNPEWETPFTDRPDSLVVWVKYNPLSNDTAKVEAILHTDAAQGELPHDGSTAHWIGRARWTTGDAIASWQRISIPFGYYDPGDPDYILVVLSAGDSTEAVADSEMWLDDFELIYNPPPGASIDEQGPSYNVSSYGDILRVSLADANEASINLRGLDGRLIESYQLTEALTEIQVAVPNGIYIYELSFNGIRKTGKLKL